MLNEGALGQSARVTGRSVSFASPCDGMSIYTRLGVRVICIKIFKGLP
jgi:hypothetical protein